MSFGDWHAESSSDNWNDTYICLVRGFNGDWSRGFEYIRVGWDSTGDLIGQTGFGQFDPLDRERFSSISSRGSYTCALLMDGTQMY